MATFTIITDQADADTTIEADSVDVMGDWLVFRSSAEIVAAYSSHRTVSAIKMT